MKKFFLDNWKTNMFSLAALVVVGLYVAKIINTEQLVAIQGFIVAMGFAVCRDSGNDNG